MPVHDAVVDLSHYQPRVDFAALKAGGIRLAILKATEGTSADPAYAPRPALLRATGIGLGSYHFLRTGKVKEQVEKFLAIVKPSPGALCVLDYEDVKGRETPSAAEAAEWCDRVEAAVGGQVLVYGYGAFLDAHVPVGHALARRPLWFARYPTENGQQVSAYHPGMTIGKLPEAWKSRPTEVVLWQYTSKGVVSGVSGGVDRSIGDVDALLRRWPGALLPG